MCEECGCGELNAPATTTKTVTIEENILSKNIQFAEEIRHELARRKTLMINLMSSPGSGKTSLLEKSLPSLMKEFKVAVIEGDVQTRYDAERLKKLGIPVFQVNTGGACHLNALSIKKLLDTEPFLSAQIIIIENVGNLVCPSAFDLGEDDKVVFLSVTEGDDKPEKYPAAFAVASAMMITKTDLLPYVNFDVERCKESAWQVHPGLPQMLSSSVKEEGIKEWQDWLRHQLSHKAGTPHEH